MPDWTELVGGRLRNLRSDGEWAEVVGELGAHLEEIYEEARSQGMNEATAVNFALQEVDDWDVLARRISRTKSKEGIMNKRTTTLWFPAVLSLLGASLLLMALELLEFRPHVVWTRGIAMTLYWHWLIGLPFFGALGAYLSQRANGPVIVRLASGLAPALVMLVVMSLILPWGLAIDGFHFFRLVAFGVLLTNWVVIPAVALLIGTAPFLRASTPATHREPIASR